MRDANWGFPESPPDEEYVPPFIARALRALDSYDYEQEIDTTKAEDHGMSYCPGVRHVS